MTTVMSPPPRLATQVSRNPTMPMTKRESLVMNGSRWSLLSNGSVGSAVQRPINTDADTTNTHPNMVAGKKRTPTKVKRTNSYKRALNRQSANDELDNVLVVPVGTESSGGVRASKDEAKLKRSDDRKKYNTLPIRAEDIESAQLTVRNSDGRRARERSQTVSGEFTRNSSTRSGNYPSPDTDDDQRSVQPERKRKSRFKRVKERLIHTFMKDRSDDANKTRSMKNKLKAHASPKRVHVRHSRGSHSKPQAAFHTPPETVTGKGIEVLIEEPNNNNATPAIDISGTNKGSTGTEIQKKRNVGFFASIRNSFRRKESPVKYRTSTDRQTPSSDSLHPISETSPPPSAGASPSRGPYNDTRRALDVHDGPFDPDDDDVVKFFDRLINPYNDQPAGQRADRSKLRLDGLRRNRPASGQTSGDRMTFRSSLRGSRRRDLSPDIIEVDGDVDDHRFDQVDYQGSTVASGSDIDFADVVEDDQQHRVDEVATRLAAIGDRIAIERESESEVSDVEGIYPGEPRRLSDMEEEVMQALRDFADGREKQNKPVKICILPIIKDILVAQTYSNFKQVVTRELANTHGWDQVAWYTYLIRTAVCVAGTGRQVGNLVSRHARQYFSDDMRPFINTRARGWESIHEETDADTELD